LKFSRGLSYIQPSEGERVVGSARVAVIQIALIMGEYDLNYRERIASVSGIFME
jgi:hypothetical protein